MASGRSGGPRKAVSNAPLSTRGLPACEPDRACAWIEKYCVVPKGSGAGKPLRLRQWQRDIVGTVFAEQMPRLAGISLPRGSGKSTLLSAMALHAFVGRGEMGASVVCAAVDQRQAEIVFKTCVRFVELNPQLEKRIKVYQDKLIHPASGSELRVYPADPKSLEGLDFSFCVLDEFGVISRDTFEVLAHAQGKREQSTLACIGTPSPMGTDSVMWSLREAYRANPDDTSTRWIEYAAPDGCDVDDEDAWAIASPALGDFLHADALRALLPPKTSENVFRRARLGQWVLESDAQWTTRAVWDATCDPDRTVPDGTPIVIGFDGSWKGDCTCLVGATIEPVPHLFVIDLWKPPANNPDWRVPVERVEAAIEAACRRWDVREVACDPSRWQRSISVLAGRGLPMVEFAQSPNRMIAATKSLYDALVDGDITHDDNPDFAEHVTNARAKDDGFGTQVKKVTKHSEKKIDLLVAGIMAHSRATWLASKKPKRAKVYRSVA